MIEGTHQPTPATGDNTAALAPGSRLGKYEIVERLATGGMAEIFLARASGMLGFQKLVVIKRILPHLASRNDFIQMFLDEARIATTLNHPNVVQTYEVGVQGKSYFLVMEYLAGEDVRSIVRACQRKQVRLPVEHALQIIIGVASGLNYAHEKRDFDGKPLDIVHRDVTPQNLIVSYDGGVKLLDFGIAKASNRINETRSGSFKGKVPYLSPEQCRGEKLDRRTDVFSLGILLYEITLQRRLFRGDTDFQILKQIADGAVLPPRQVDPDYDPRLEAIVMKALDTDPARRFQTAREMQEALERLAHDARLRLSPLGLADFMQALFSDKVNRWAEVREVDDAEKLERHFATVAAEREADLAAEEANPTELEPSTPPVGSRSPNSVELAPLPDPDEEPPARRAGALGWAWALAAAVLVAGGTTWFLRSHAQAHLPSPASLPSLVVAAPAPAAELPAPPIEEAAATGSVLVNTTPPGATLVLDGRTLPQRSPARLERVVTGGEHTLQIRLGGYASVAQRFQLDGGEEATLDIDLRKNGHASMHRAHEARALPKPAAVAAKPAVAAPVTPAPSPVRAEGEGTLVIASSPWCNVTIDGQARGTTPVSVKVKSGAHEVVLSNAEFHIKRSLELDVEPGQTVRKKLDFAPAEND
jgi:serine/threonine protein kinase